MSALQRISTIVIACLLLAFYTAATEPTPTVAPGTVASATEPPTAELPADQVEPRTVTRTGKYTVIAWNDLGMHCISPRFKEMAILPPYNNLWAIVIRRSGEDPSMVTSGLAVTYSIDHNTKVAGKTDFWTYAPKLFGKTLKPGIGLTGNGLSGKMKVVGDHFEASGVPALPYFDSMTWNPYQHATIRLSGAGASGITATNVPVSDEMDCRLCHKTGGVASGTIRTATVEGNILTLHDRREKTHLMASRPVLCASCHSDNALGTKGVKGVMSMSLAMHGKHASLASQPACYNCHPGAKTQCNRSAAPSMGPAGTNPRCELCHGNLTKMAQTLTAGRKPWLQEPTCAQCHGAKYSTGTTLYRQAKGHGGVYCIACHGSPHAWYPSKRGSDNVQPQGLQHNSRALGYNGCSICHADGRNGKMPPHSGEGGGGD